MTVRVCFEICGAHPRSRGENMTVKLNSSVNQGSSPLTRGKLEGGHDHVDARRLIPAHAGKTEALEWAARELGAHPRSRGENRATHTLATDD